MRDQALREYENACLMCNSVEYTVKEKAEQFLENFIKTPENSELLQFILKQSENPLVLFVTVELLTKTYLVDTGIGIIEYYGARSQKEGLSKEDVLKENLIENMLVILKDRGEKMPSYVLNSFTNFIGIGLKLLWLQLEKKKEIIETISASFFGDQSKRLNVGLNIYLMLLKNLQLSNYSLGYAKYRNILNSFQKEVLLSLFINTKQVLMIYMQQIFSGDLTSVQNNDIETALEVMNHILTYPFAICYLEFTAEGSTDSNSATMFPDSWRPYFVDLQYFEGLVRLLAVEDLSADSKLFAVKNLSKIASCKRNLVPTELEQSNIYIQFLLDLPGSIAARVDMRDSINLEEVVDLLERSISVYTLGKLMDQGQKSEGWINSLLNITRTTIGKCYKLNEKVFNSVSAVWKNIASQVSTPIYEYALTNFLKLYYLELFQENNSLNIFSDVNYSQFEKIKEFINDRYKVFQSLYSKHKELLHNFFCTLSKNVFSEFEQLVARLGNGSLHEKEVPIQLSKFLNLLLIISSSVLSENYYGYGAQKTQVQIEGMSLEELDSMILGCSLKCISMLDSFNTFLDTSMRRHTEMVLVFFFETFFKKIAREITFKDKADNGTVLNRLECKSALFVLASSHQTIYDSFDNYLILTINKCLGNLAIGDKVIGRYSIYYLKTMVEELKRQLPQTDFNKISIPSHISKELLNINSTNLSLDPTFFKLRSDLYEIVSICYLDEGRDDYIENMHNILQRILELDMAGSTGDNPLSVIMLFRDVIGLIRPMKMGGVYLVFLKVAYKGIQKIINEAGLKLISNEYFVVTLLEFYEILCFTSLDKMGRDSHTYFYTVLNDTFKLLSSLANECNNQIKSHSYEQIIAFFKRQHKITSKFLTIGNSILKNKSVNYGVFHYFGDQNFVYFLEQLLNFVFIIVPVLDVESHMIHEDSEIIKIKDLVKSIASYLHDELLIHSSEQIEKITAVRNGLLGVSSEFASYVIEACLRLNYTSRVNNCMADLFLNLRWMANNDEAFHQCLASMLQNTIAVRSGHQEAAGAILGEFYGNYRQMSLNFISMNRFREIFSSFVSKLIEQVIKGD